MPDNIFNSAQSMLDASSSGSNAVVLPSIIDGISNPFGGSSNLNFDNADDVLAYLKKYKGSEANRDILFNYLLSEKSAQTAREWEAQQNSTRYQMMVEDLKKAGINPYWLNSLGGAANFDTSGNHYSGSAFQTAKRDAVNATKASFEEAGKVASVIGAVVSAVMLGLALL